MIPNDCLFTSHRDAVLKLREYTCEAWAELVVKRAESELGRSFRYPLAPDLEVRVKATRKLVMPGYEYPCYVVIPYKPSKIHR